MSVKTQIYLGRQEYLFSINELYRVANELTLKVTKLEVNRDRFMKLITTSLSRMSNVEGGSPINYVYHENSDSHFTNFKGLMLLITYCPPNIRLKFIEAISKLITIASPMLDQERRNLAVLQIQGGDAFLLSDDCASQILHDPDNTAELMSAYNRRMEDEETERVAAKPVVETGNAEATGVR